MGKARTIPVQGLAAAPARDDEHSASPCLPRTRTPTQDWRPSPSVHPSGKDSAMNAGHTRRGASLAMLLASMLLAAPPVALGAKIADPVGAEAGQGKAADPAAAEAEAGKGK